MFCAELVRNACTRWTLRYHPFPALDFGVRLGNPLSYDTIRTLAGSCEDHAVISFSFTKTIHKPVMATIRSQEIIYVQQLLAVTVCSGLFCSVLILAQMSSPW